MVNIIINLQMYKMGEITWKKFANPSHDPYKIYFTSNRYICIACIPYIVNLSFYNAITWLQRNVLLFSSDFYTNAFSSSHTLWTRNCNQKTVYNDHLSSSKSRYTHKLKRITVISQESDKLYSNQLSFYFYYISSIIYFIKLSVAW